MKRLDDGYSTPAEGCEPGGCGRRDAQDTAAPDKGNNHPKGLAGAALEPQTYRPQPERSRPEGPAGERKIL